MAGDALGYYATERAIDRKSKRKITGEVVDKAAALLIGSSLTSQRSLLRLFSQPGPQRAWKALLAFPGGVPSGYLDEEDVGLCVDLGIVKREVPLRFANPISAGVISNNLGAKLRLGFKRIWASDFTKSRPMVMSGALKAFQQTLFEDFDGTSMTAQFARKDAQSRVANFASVATERMLSKGQKIKNQLFEGYGQTIAPIHGKRYAIETEVRDSQTSLPKSLERMKKLLDSLGEEEDWLLIFDLERIKKTDRYDWVTEIAPDGELIHLVTR